MPRAIHFRSRYTTPSEKVFTTMVDRGYLEARLSELGGRNPTVVELTHGPDSARVVLRQGVGREHLPSPLRRLFSGDLVIERAETWRKTGDGRYEATVGATVADAPGQIDARLRLADLADSTGSELIFDGSAKVDLPLIGGKIESLIAQQVVQLIGREAQFTEEWLNR